MPHTLVSFHAHPDDEALLCAGSLARAAAEGHRVVLVVATSGEAGEADTSVLDGESLGERRRAETMASAEALGVARVVFLGYADSGLDGAASPGGATTFVAAPPDEAAGRLAAVLTEEDADVLTTYDANGGYGHPDHVRVHEVGALAAAMAHTPVVLESTVNRDVLYLGLQIVRSMGFEIPPEFDPAELEAWFSPADAVTHTIDVSAHLAAKRASMAAHATQATSDSASSVRTLARILELPDDLYALAFGTEWFIEHGRDPADSADDIFASLGDGP